MWNKFWSKLLSDKKIRSKVNDINYVDTELYGELRIENICHKIYDEYESYKVQLETIRQDLLLLVEKFPGIHLQTSRVKELDSLLCKVIKKRHAHMLDDNNPYHNINEQNYNDIITDLIGIRLIISYRGRWIDLHKCIIEEFPYVEDIGEYNNNPFIPHPKDGKSILAEIPKVYYAYGDDLSIYENAVVEKKLKENGYRSVHYVVSFKGIYIEIQTRTIYDEAWSDCDHNYVYKQESHVSFSALSELSKVLSLLTNASNDLGEKMQYIFENEILQEKEGKYFLKSANSLKIREISDRMKTACNLLDEFNDKVVEMRGEDHE